MSIYLLNIISWNTKWQDSLSYMFYCFYFRNRVSQECIGDKPLDMIQYKKIFGTCRIPHDTRDYLVFNSKSDYITVAYKNNFYKVTVKEGLAWQNHSAIFEQFKEIVKENNEGLPVGLLTSECRDDWYKAYDELKKSIYVIKTL